MGEGNSDSSVWPQVELEDVNVFEFSGIQNFSLKKIEKRWLLFEDSFQSVADLGHLKELVAILNNISFLKGEFSSDFLEKQEQISSNTSTQLLSETNSTQLSEKYSANGNSSTLPQHIDGDGNTLREKFVSGPATLTIQGKDNIWKLTLLDSLDGKFLSVEVVKNNGAPQIVHVDPQLSRVFSQPGKYYADLHLFSAKPERVLHIEVASSGNEVWELNKVTEGTFSFIQPERVKGIEVPQAGMEFYLHAILSTQSPNMFFTKIPAELSAPFLIVKTVQEKSNISIGSEQLEEVLTISRMQGHDEFIGYSSYQQAYFSIGTQKVEHLGRALLSLRSRPVFPRGIGQIYKTRLTVWDNRGEEQVREFSRNSSGWNEYNSDTNLVGVDTIFWRISTLQTEGKTENIPPKDLLPVMSWEFFTRDNSAVPLKLTFFCSDKPDKQHWVRIGKNTPLYPVQPSVITEILALLPAPKVRK